MRTKSLLLPLAIAAAGATSPAFADFNGGDFILRVGAAYMDLDTSSALSAKETVLVKDPNDPTKYIPVDGRLSLSLDSDTTWFINGTYFVADHWAVELYHMNSADLDTTLNASVSTPDVRVKDSATFGSFETYVTSFFVDWYPVCAESWVQPYVGIGVNYTDIEQDYLRPVFVENVPGVGPVDRGLVNFGSSFGWTAQVGIDIEFGRDANWLFNASAMYVDADPELELGFDVERKFGNDNVRIGNIRIKDDMDYDSWIFNLGVGYKFSF